MISFFPPASTYITYIGNTSERDFITPQCGQDELLQRAIPGDLMEM